LDGWSISRPPGRERIETSLMPQKTHLSVASPDLRVGSGLKQKA